MTETFILHNEREWMIIMNIPFSPPSITEREIEAVVDTLRSGWITTGPKTKLFEQRIAEYCGTKKAVCLNSATAALELTLRVLGITAGDEVITSAYTYTASASVITHVGATPVLVDVAPDSFEMDYAKLAAAITPRTKAIIPVDIAGAMCRYDTILELAARDSGFTPNNDIAAAIGRIAVIADAAHSFGAVRDGIISGGAADFTCFSFHAVKNLTTGEGGAVTFNPTLDVDMDDLYKQYMILSLHGQTKDALAKTQLGSWEYDILAPAYKCNMTDIMAAIGLVQLERYGDMLAHRQALIAAYNAAFKGSDVVPLCHEGSNYQSSGHLYITRLMGRTIEQRNSIIMALAENGISANVHYKPLPLLTAYRNLGFDIANYPNAYAVYHNELTLPLHAEMTVEQAQYVAEALLKVM